MNRELEQARLEYIEDILTSVLTTSDRKYFKQTILDIKKKLAD
jgi:hypothetical protein|tara:strand:+ start:1924 stop:2052 length:129 start_codon:yes stop_codon:yes gene_type:complete